MDGGRLGGWGEAGRKGGWEGGRLGGRLGREAGRESRREGGWEAGREERRLGGRRQVCREGGRGHQLWSGCIIGNPASPASYE